MSKYDLEREKILDRKFPERYLWDAANQRSKKFNIEFNLKIEDIVIPEFCPILNVRLEQIRGRRKFAPSIDRKDSSLGYTKENIAVISWQANKYKSNMSKEDIERLYDYISS